MDIKSALVWGQQQLSLSDSAKLDSEVLLAYVLEKERVFLFTWPEKKLQDRQLMLYQQMIAERRCGKPIAYLVGAKEFWSLQIKVSEHTLIPRPDTELLVEKALQLLADKSQAKILDLGTGTGAIAIALASERKDAIVVAIDRVFKACELARENARLNHITNLEIRHGSWFEPIQVDEQFDLIISNPPYIDANDQHLSLGDVRFEPRSALVSSEKGLADISHIVSHAKAYLNFGCPLLIEHGNQQSNAVQSIFSQHGFLSCASFQDYAGNDRLTLGFKQD